MNELRSFVSRLPSRREFLKTSAVAGVVLAAPALLTRQAFGAENSDTLRVGLIGCGGRGTGAAGQALHADQNAVLVAVADVFPEPMTRALDSLKKDAAIAARVQVPP
ncbi:MAG TPA: twin-arginine translocation signal domain-containing protein, partial [Verrucomicrobiae bacterium]